MLISFLFCLKAKQNKNATRVQNILFNPFCLGFSWEQIHLFWILDKFDYLRHHALIKVKIDLLYQLLLMSREIEVLKPLRDPTRLIPFFLQKKCFLNKKMDSFSWMSLFVEYQTSGTLPLAPLRSVIGTGSVFCHSFSV